MLFHVVSLLLTLSSAQGQLIQQVWTSVAFAPQAASVTSQVASPSFSSSSSFPALCSARFSGTIVDATATEMMTFSVVTDGGVRMWIDEHLVIDAAGNYSHEETHTKPIFGLLNVPFLAGVPVPFRLEYSRWGVDSDNATATLQLSWSGNTTNTTIIPASAFSTTVSNFIVQRDALRDRLEVPAVPWQTYSLASMGAHVLMPAGLALKASLGLTGEGDPLPAIVPFRMNDPASVRPGLRSINGSDYTLVTISSWRAAPNATVTFETTVTKGGDLIFIATCVSGDCTPLLLFVSPFMMSERAGTFSTTSLGTLRADLPGFASVTATAMGDAAPVAVPDCSGAGIVGDVCFALPLGTGPVGFYTGAGAPPSVAAAQAAIAAAAAATRASEARFGELESLYQGMNSALAWNTVYTPYEGVITPVSHEMGNIWGMGFILFEWDTYFLALTASMVAGRARDLAYANLMQVTLGRTLAGFVPNGAAGPRRAYDRSEDQVGAFVFKTILDKTGDDWLLEGLLPVMLSWNDWVWARRRGEGVFAGADGYADLMCLGSEDSVPRSDTQNNMQAARYEGMDNSPIYDEPASFDTTTHHMDLYDVGATALFASDTEATIALCAKAPVGSCPDRTPSLSDRLSRVQAAMNTHMWDASTGMYANIFFNGSKIDHFAPTSIWPMISGAASDAQAAALVSVVASPRGFCYNTSHTPAPDADFLLQWDHKGGFRACVSAECTAEGLKEGDRFLNVEAVALKTSGGPAPGLVALNLFSSDTTGASALVAGPPPDASFTLVRQEGWCYQAPPDVASGWPTTPLTLWFSEKAIEYKTCGTPTCEAESAASGDFALIRTMCYAFNGTGIDNAPCKVGGASLIRSDSNFVDNSYWRGRLWAPHHMLFYWALARYDHLPAARQARLDLVSMGADLQHLNWDNSGVICENVNGLIGTCEDSGDADPFYTWGALFGFTSFIESGVY